MDLRLPPILFTLVFASANANEATRLSADACLRQSDDLVREVGENPDSSNAMLLQLTELDEACPELPQLKHNLGVLHAHNQDWNKSIAYFEESLAMDTRASHTADMLEKIHRFHAVQAYREALQSNNPPPSPPVLELQKSDLTNFNIDAKVPTIDPAASEEQINELIQQWWDFSSGKIESCDRCFATGASLQKPDETGNKIAGESLPNATVIKSGNNRVVILQTAKNHVFALRLKPDTEEFGTNGWQIDQLQVLP